MTDEHSDKDERQRREWILQQGLGDADAQGQTTLDGGVRPEGGESS